MSGKQGTVFRGAGFRAIAGNCLLLGVATLMAACSNNVSRFDYAALSNNSGDNLTTASLNPVPTEAVYPNGAPASGTSVVRQDLPPPQPRQYAAAQPAGVQPAPLPPQPRYQSPPPYQPPAAPQARYQPPPPPAPPPPSNKTIHVRSGDTLFKLAKEHDVTVEEIKSANDLRNTRLSIGQELVIPVDGAPPAPEGPSYNYTVQRGDSISKIARDRDVSLEKLIAANDLKRPYTLQPGEILKVPGKKQTTVAQTQGRVRLAARGSNVSLPSTNPSRGGSSDTQPARTSIAAPRPQQKVAARTENLPKPEPMAGNQFRWPVKGRIVAGFGPKAGGKHNDGINVAVPKGTSIKAAENGVVAYAGSELEPYGNLILIRHSNNWVTAYAHNDELLVKRGDTVQRGQVIAKAGQSGSVSQPQLHFELRKGSKPVDPLSYMASNSS